MITKQIMEQPESLLWQAAKNWLEKEQVNFPKGLWEKLEQLYEAVEAGHVCITVQMAAARKWFDTGWVGEPGSGRPFIVEGDKFYLARYRENEQGVADKLAALAQAIITPTNDKAISEDLDKLFPQKDASDQQRLAVLLSQFHRLTLISGGPGTGKTTTVVKILAMLQLQAQREKPSKFRNILLAAPTGKAAQRLTESIRHAKNGLALPKDLIDAIPEEAQTLHRLLGAMGDTGRFRHNKDNPLSCDLLLIDEASMIDLGMMQSVLSALPSTARLVLLGDRNQLASVEAGSVFGDLCATEGMSDALKKMLKPFDVEVSAKNPLGLLADCRVELSKSYRFNDEGGVGQLAKASREGDTDTFLKELSPSKEFASERRINPAQLKSYLQKTYEPYLEVALNNDPATAFKAFNAFRVLCAHRKGLKGIEGINALLDKSGTWVIGRPIIVRHNDYALRLFNGDIGICLQTTEGLRVFFESTPGNFRQFATGRLPAHEPAWALTVHQSQGSEFDKVLLVLPDEPSRVVDRPLIYTAVTRAKQEVLVCGEDAVIRAALAQLPERASGLVDKLKIQ